MDRYNRQQLGETKREYKYLVEYHKKISLPVACILFVIVGGSLGMTSRKGSLWVGVVIGCGCFLLYWISLLRGEAMADKLEMKPWLAMWISNILVGFFSIVFLIRSVVLLRK
jgi:lipopolysaccharide export system permease protein